jgi:leucyl/phenylalanyl-tRNA---protein transferase
MPPVEPPPSVWDFPPATSADPDGVVGLGADLEPGTLLAAYRAGIFPMPLHRNGPMAWWSPDPRGIIPIEDLRVSRSTRRSRRRFEVRVDTAFDSVTAACADPGRRHGWITEEIRAAYRRLHGLGWAHSVEAWTPDGELVGGLYGLAIGGLFAGESMFHVRTDASKVVLVELVERLAEAGVDGRLLDVQWATPHLVSLGAVAIPARTYFERLDRALRLPLPPAFVR